MTTRIVVLGAGYAGLPAARRLINRLGGDADVTVVSASPSFVERPRLHQTATGQRLRELPLAGLVGEARGGSLIVGRIGDIDLVDRRIRVQARGGEQTLGYDVLVYALGSTVDVRAVPGVAAHAHTLSDAGSAERLSGALATASPGSTVAVCGGGLCGIEMAAELAESRPDLRVRLVSRTEPGAWQAPRARRYLRRTFDRLGVEVLAGAGIRKVAEDALVLDGDRRVPYDLCVWAGGFTVPSLAQDAGLAVDDQGRIMVDETLRSVSHPDVYAIGDAAAVPGPWGAALAYGCRTGGFTAPCAADAIADRLAGRTPRSFRFRYFHECVSLGRRDAFIQFLRADQNPSRWVLTGRLAVWYKNIVLDSAKLVFRHPGPYTPRRRTAARPAEPAPLAS
ncbi:FAD-dependent oxidoreductase [Actinoallomurus acanthiterrae]